MPGVIVYGAETGTPLTADNLTANSISRGAPVPSSPSAGVIDTVGAGSSSTIAPVAVALVPPLIVSPWAVSIRPTTVSLTVPSCSTSLTIRTPTVALDPKSPHGNSIAVPGCAS